MAAPQQTVSVNPDIGTPGMIADYNGLAHADTLSVTSKETSAGIPFGVMVQQGTLDDDALLMTAANNKLKGVALWANDFARFSELTAAGITPGTTFGVMFKGPVLVQVEDAVTPASSVHVRWSANGGNTQVGAFRGTADATHSIDCSAFCKYLTSAGAGGVATVYVDLTNSALAVADT